MLEQKTIPRTYGGCVASDLIAKIAAEASVFLAAERAAADERPLCSTLSFWLQHRLLGEATWDRYAWFDDILPLHVQVADRTVEIVGGVVVVSGKKYSVAPVKASLRIGDDGALASIVVRFGMAGEHIPYKRSFKLHKLRVPENPSEWSYTFTDP